MPSKLATIAFDADDTLWQNEQFFRLTQERFAELLADFVDPDHLHERLLEAEQRNLGHYGFGIKGFVLSMVETALDVTEHKVPGEVIAELLAAGRDMLQHPIELLPQVRETIETLAPDFELMVITKGDLLDQERKIAQSGLGDLFDRVEIVSEKTAMTYAHAFKDTPGGPPRAMMVGNSLRSDVLPALGAGAFAVYVPHDLTWVLEHAEAPPPGPRYFELTDLGGLPEVIAQLNS